MSTSGSYDATSTLSTILYSAFGLIGAIDDRETMEAEEWVYGRRMLNKAMAYLSIHKGLWLVSDVSVTLTPGTASYTMGVGETIDTPKPMRVTHAYRDGDTDVPMDVVSRQEYISLPNKTLQSPANLVYYSPGVSTGTLYVWPTGTSDDNAIQVTTQRPIQDFDVEGNNPDLPEEWVLLCEYELATLLAPKYLGGEVPPHVKAKRDELLQALIAFDEEEQSMYMQP